MSALLSQRVNKVAEPPVVDMEKELEQEEMRKAAITQEINKFYQQNYHNVNVLSDFLKSLVFGPDDGSATENDIEAIVSYIIGERNVWGSDSTDLREFQHLIEQSFVDDWSEFHAVNPSITEHQAMRSLPQKFTRPALRQAQLEMLIRTSANHERSDHAALFIRLFYIDMAGCASSLVREFTFDTTADDALRSVMDHSMGFEGVATNENGGPTVYVFRVQGRNEYIYGNERLISFKHIRESLSKHKEICLVFEPIQSDVLHAPLFRPLYWSQAQPNRRHLELSRNTDASELSAWDIEDKLSFRLVGGLGNLTLSPERQKEDVVRDASELWLAVVAEAYFGTERGDKARRTDWTRAPNVFRQGQEGVMPYVLWEDGCGDIVFDMEVSHAPRELKLCFTLVAVAGDKLGVVADIDGDALLRLSGDAPGKKSDDLSKLVVFLGTGTTQLYDTTAHMKAGPNKIYLWESSTRANPVGVGANNPDENACTFVVQFPAFPKPVVMPSGRPPKRMENEARALRTAHEDAMNEHLVKNEVEQLRQLKRVLKFDPLMALSTDDKILLWKYRHVLLTRPRAVAKFVLAVNWFQPFEVYEAHTLLCRWYPLAPFDALELLDARYADTAVRELAVCALGDMLDYDLSGCILQLVHVLKYEPYHYSALARFLLRRSMQSSHVIGHYVFWYLTAEVKNPQISERHGLLLEELLRRSPLRKNYLRQVYVTNELLKCALEVQKVQKKDRETCLRENLALIRFPQRFTLALNPAMECCGVEVNKCKVMDSKKFPLRLAFKNARDDADNFYVIFKTGDDLRQDLLTLQMLDLMDTAWKETGLDLNIIPYGCISTGEGVGMIEVVLNSETIANITRKEGGAQAAFSDDPLLNWLRQFNKDRSEVEQCMWNFVHSVAGYTVASYILGIGDRHNDNIMLRQDGTLFHIDFGHFLGNFKTKFGFKRETAPFVFTPMYLYVMGGSNSAIYKYFVSIACQAYNVIRKCSSWLIMLFMLMLSTGIPELQTKEDIEWLRTVLLLDKTDEEATEHYKNLISVSLGNIRTLINDYIHIMAH